MTLFSLALSITDTLVARQQAIVGSGSDFGCMCLMKWTNHSANNSAVIRPVLLPLTMAPTGPLSRNSGLIHIWGYINMGGMWCPANSSDVLSLFSTAKYSNISPCFLCNYDDFVRNWGCPYRSMPILGHSPLHYLPVRIDDYTGRNQDVTPYNYRCLVVNHIEQVEWCTMVMRQMCGLRQWGSLEHDLGSIANIGGSSMEPFTKKTDRDIWEDHSKSMPGKRTVNTVWCINDCKEAIQRRRKHKNEQKSHQQLIVGLAY